MFDEATRNTYVNVTRWFDTIMHQDEVVRILGETPLCVKPAQFDGMFTGRWGVAVEGGGKKKAYKRNGTLIHAFNTIYRQLFVYCDVGDIKSFFII